MEKVRVVMCLPARRHFAIVILALLAASSGCVQISRRVNVEEVQHSRDGLEIVTPLKAHLLSGAVVVFPEGAIYSVADTVLAGAGTRYDVDLSTRSVSSVPLDSIAAMETFRQDVLELPSILGTVAATAASVALVSVAAVAIFGSCPTVYSERQLQAETFSHSVSRLMEVRDVDRLEIRPSSDDLIRLDVRNEALETHYINHLELLRTSHRPDEVAVPRRDGRALLLSNMHSATATDREGKDVTAILGERDDLHYRTDDDILAAASIDDMTDYVELSVAAPSADSVAVLFRGRSSLLTSAMLYDFMLSQGPGTLDYNGIDLESIGEAMALGALFREHLGLHVYVYQENGWRHAGRLGMSGPVAWEMAAIQIPVPDEDSLRVRIEFLADSWRLDQVLIAYDVREVPVSRIRLTAVEGVDKARVGGSLTALSEADDAYYIGSPGQSFTAVFGPVPPSPAEDTYFLAAQGYYTEWIRRHWLDRPAKDFEASTETLLSIVRHWAERRIWYEENFFANRVPVDLP